MNLQDKKLLQVSLAIGIMIRIAYYLMNRSLWLDEAFLALNVKSRSFDLLAQPLDYYQVAPIGFLWIEKIFLLLLGANEYALRLFPLLSSIFFLLLAYRLLSEFIVPRNALVPFLLICLSPTLVYFASEVKQYQIDLFIFTLLFYLFFRLIKQEQQKQILLIGLVGILFIWTSNISFFVLPSIIIVIVHKMRKNQLQQKLYWLTTIVIWITAGILYYFLYLHNHPHNAPLLAFWKEQLITIPYTVEQAQNFGKNFWSLVRYPLHLKGLTIIPVLLFLTGIIYMWKVKRMMLVLLLPILVHMVTSIIGLFPFQGRLLVYAAFSVAVAIGFGVEAIGKKFQNRSALITISLLLLMIFRPIQDLVVLFSSEPREHIKPALKYVAESLEESNQVIASYGSIAAFRFYRSEYFPAEIKAYEGNVCSQIHYAKGKTWVIFSHPFPRSERQMLKEYLMVKEVEVLDNFQNKDVTATLYHFK